LTLVLIWFSKVEIFDLFAGESQAIDDCSFGKCVLFVKTKILKDEIMRDFLLTNYDLLYESIDLSFF